MTEKTGKFIVTKLIDVKRCPKGGGAKPDWPGLIHKEADANSLLIDKRIFLASKDIKGNYNKKYKKRTPDKFSILYHVYYKFWSVLL